MDKSSDWVARQFIGSAEGRLSVEPVVLEPILKTGGNLQE